MEGRIIELNMPSLKSDIEYITIKCKIDRSKDENLFQKCCDAFRDNEDVEVNPIFDGDCV